MKVQKAQPMFTSENKPQIQFKEIKICTGDKPAWQILAEQNKTPNGFGQKSQIASSKLSQQTTNSHLLNSYNEHSTSILNTDSIYADIYPDIPPQSQMMEPEAFSEESSQKDNKKLKSKLPKVELEESHEFRPFYERKRIQKQIQQETETQSTSFLKLKEQSKYNPTQKKNHENSQIYQDLKTRNQQLKDLINQQVTSQKRQQYFNYDESEEEVQDTSNEQYRVIRPTNFTRHRVKNEDNNLDAENKENQDSSQYLSKIDYLIQKIDALDRRFNLNLEKSQYSTEQESERENIQINPKQRLHMDQHTNQQQYRTQKHQAEQNNIANAYNSYQEQEHIEAIVDFKPDSDKIIKELQENKEQMQQENKLLQETIKILQQQLQNQELMEQNRMNNQLLMRQIQLQEQMLEKNTEQQLKLQQQQMHQLREKYQREWKEERQAPPSKKVNYLDQYNNEFNRKLVTQKPNNWQQTQYQNTKIIDPYAEEPRQYKVANFKQVKGKQKQMQEEELLTEPACKQNKQKNPLAYDNFRIPQMYDAELEELDDAQQRLQLQIDNLFD